MTNPEEKPLAWLGSSKKDLMALPMGVRKSGIATPKPDMDIIRERLKIAEKLAQEMADE